MKLCVIITISEYDQAKTLPDTLVALPLVWVENKTFVLSMEGRTRAGGRLVFHNLEAPFTWARAYAEQIVLCLGVGTHTGVWDDTDGRASFSTQFSPINENFKTAATHFGIHAI